MKLFSFIFLNFSHGQEWCTVQRAAELCKNDSDMQYRQCLGRLFPLWFDYRSTRILAEFGCWSGDTSTNPNSRCTNDRKSACWYEHKARKTACPCGNGQDGCGSGDWCRGKSNSILLTREGDPETLIFSHVMNPAGSEDHFGHDKIYSGAANWNIKSNRFSCSFQLGDRMFIVGGEGSTYGYDSYELQFAPPQWIAKVGSQTVYYLLRNWYMILITILSWKNFQTYQSDSKKEVAMLILQPTQWYALQNITKEQVMLEENAIILKTEKLTIQQDIFNMTIIEEKWSKHLFILAKIACLWLVE